ncbi:helicase-related protein [Streptacidiphilus jiangxiensis]|uniref:Helicase conserved C-terminal domain-containing protein n=1 Tax=Streptacidiphilus jiangxiensis TaxID=235985 RepID=A0A1H7RFW9_STRJI|nr:helicase-related protein [Streptacidiphilus jiangxiensis]SEL59126.1 Helicase conserved C-terminal domain-containing protein [Streptacidiphilus jiangxiensis]
MSVPAFEPTLDQQTAIVEHLVRAVVADGTGEGDGGVCLGEPPSARYYMESLAPRGDEASGAGVKFGRSTPDSLGFEFEAEVGSTIEISARASFYYAALPTREEQHEWAGDREEAFRLAPLFRRKDVVVGPVEVTLDAGRRVRSILEQEFSQAFGGQLQDALADPGIDRRPGDDRRERLVPPSAMQDDVAFAQWLASVAVGTPLVPAPAARVVVSVRPVADGRLRVTVTLQNCAAEPTVVVQGRGRNAGRARRDEARDHFLFRAGIDVRGDGLLPITMDLGADAYRYSGALPAYANNCGVQAQEELGRLLRIRSVPVPTHDTFRADSVSSPEWTFESLMYDPLPILDDLAEGMDSYLRSPVWDGGDLVDQPELAARKAADREGATLEVRRFRDGISWLRRDPRLLLAFQLANETMAELGRRRRTSTGRPGGWRLFQLVSIVSQVSALAWREYPESDFEKGLWGDEDSADPTTAATVIWYPTGGGKTEAYLGLVITAMFYDRARGKSAGVTAWCRFPLRLLTLQQTQRQMNAVALANMVRERAADRLEAVGGSAGNNFLIGFYAGAGNTPNSLTSDPGLLGRLRSDEEARRRYRLVDECPYCGERTVDIPPPDEKQLQLVHVCTSPSCGRRLPIVVVDTEIYRFLPSVVVGTLDKLANIGLSDRFGSLLGDVDCRCSVHGYGRGMKCHERQAPGHAKAPVQRLAPLYDPSPSLEIVDELHMVQEELGVFSGHYEGLLAEVQRVLSARQRQDGRGVRTKVVATTATIRGEDRQCEHLFGLRSVVVPLPGPTLDESFYWRLDRARPLRRFVGIMPTNGTAEMTLVRILTSLHRALQSLASRQNLPVALAEWAPEELTRTVDLYRTSLTYTTALPDFAKISRSLDTQVNEILKRGGFDILKTAQLSGDSRLDNVRNVLDDLESRQGEIDTVVATSMVSHGVDIDRLNLMLFHGMPKSMAEYIQASSRVGRTYHGLVFMLFNPLRERDRSHYRYHGKFHEYLDRMVEPVAINRWSRFAVRRTLPGILMGHILQVANREWWEKGHAPTHLHDLARIQQALRDPEHGGLTSTQLDDLLEAMYAVFQADRPEAAELRTDLEELVAHARASLSTAGAGAGVSAGGSRAYRATGEFLGLEHRPMTSLRDVAEGLPFYVVSDRRS